MLEGELLLAAVDEIDVERPGVAERGRALQVLDLAQIANLLSDKENARKYHGLAEKVRRGFNARFLDPERHTYANGTQTALSTALFFGLVPDDQRQGVSDTLVANVERQGHVDVGILGAKTLLRALSEGGYTDLAYRVVVQPNLPGWGYWIRQGATTLWEGWKAGPSYNHVMFGDVSVFAGRAPIELKLSEGIFFVAVCMLLPLRIGAMPFR